MTAKTAFVLGALAIFSTTALAGPRDGLATDRISGAQELRRGTIDSLRTHQVRVAGMQSKIAIGDIANRAFEEHRAIDAKLAAARGLRGAPIKRTEVVETDKATILTQSTTVTVVDAAAFEASDTTFRDARGTGSRKAFALAEMGAAEQTAFTAFKTEMLKKGAGHPLADAAKAGDQALLDAVLAGKGDVTITSTIVIPVDGVQMAGHKATVPSVAGEGFSGATAVQLNLVPQNGPLSDPPTIEVPPPLEGNLQQNRTHTFLTGFTIDDSFEWEKRWDFPSGYFRLRAGAWYAFGLRAPVEVKTVLKPARVLDNGSDPGPSTTLSISARTFDGDASDYRAAKLPESQIYEGKEFVLEAGAYVNVKVRAGWGAIKFSKTIPENNKIDFGKHFRPPQGDCAPNCGFDVWVPGELTRTKIDLALVSAEAQVGFLVGGTGKIEIAGQILDRAGPVKSYPGQRSKDLKRKHTVTMHNPEAIRTLTAALTPMTGAKDRTRKFGYAVSNPRYTWNVTLTPGIRTKFKVDASPFFELKKTFKPFWLYDLAIPMGDLTLRRHEGTIDEHKAMDGVQNYRAPMDPTKSGPGR